jgi:diguanylate cyclase (GGDEF)-like protein
MGVLELAKLYNMGKEDLEEIASLRPYFTDEFKRKLAKKTKDFVFEKLPGSAELLKKMQRERAFDKTIESFFDTLFIPEKLEIYAETVARTHRRMEIDEEDFLKDFAVFFKEILEYENIPADKFPAFKKLLFLLIITLSQIIISYLENLKTKEEIDPITKLPSKRYFVINLPQFLKSFRTILLIDLEEFKEFNLYYGYNAGNSILAFVASALQTKFKGAFITRLQNDEFLVLTTKPPDESCKSLQRLRADFQKEPIYLPTKFGTETVGLDFTVVVMDTRLCTETDSDLLMWILYNSLEEAKELPHGIVKIIDSKDVERWLNNRKTVVDVMEALNKEKVKVAFQNVVDINTGDVIFKEALARIVVDGNLVPADRFIDLITNTNIERKLDRLVVEQTLKTLKKGLIKGKVSLNLSSGFIKKNIQWFLHMLEEYNISPDSIIVELVERDDILDVKGTKENLELLKKKGVSIFIDDFGIKYANYNLLKELPIDGLKIDGSIVRDMKFNKLDSAFVSCVFQFAKIKNVKIVAEYVETEDVKKELERIVRENQIRTLYAQGYYFGKPIVLL